MSRKTCTRCMQSLPADRKHFNARSGSQTRLRCWCKPCVAEQRAERRAVIADAAFSTPLQSQAGLGLAQAFKARSAA